jgi:hypothetical protein
MPARSIRRRIREPGPFSVQKLQILDRSQIGWGRMCYIVNVHSQHAC